MNYRHLGKAGIKLSELSFGSWVTYHNQVDVEKANRAVAALLRSQGCRTAIIE